MLRNLLIVICIFFSSCALREVKNSPETKINITVKQNQEVLLNGKPIVVEEICRKLINFRSNDTINKKGLYVIHLDVDENTNSDIVTDIKQQLRKANMLRLEYSSNKKTSPAGPHKK